MVVARKPKKGRAVMEKPNILLITCDQLRYDFVGYHSPFMQTPNIDRLAAEGWAFTRAYSPCPACIPARHNLLTGLTPRHHRFDDNYFDDDARTCPYYLPTIAQILSDAKYETIAVGKMHFQPERRATGFDFFYNMSEIPPTREEDDYALFLQQNGYGGLQSIQGVRSCLYMQPQRALVPQALHGSAWVAERSIEYLRRNRGQRPFFLWSGFIHPHPPLNVPDEWADLYNGKVPPPARTQTPLSAIALEKSAMGCHQDAAVLNRMRELYAAAVSFADWHIGRILDELDALGLAENTLVLFTSDHGEMLGDLGTYQKFMPYDGSCRVPLALRWPARLPAGQKRQDFADLNDILPTLLDAAGAEYPAQYDLPGESLLARHGVKDRRVQYTEFSHGSKRWCCLRNSRYKYVHFYGDDDQLFDMENDAAETNNLLCGPLNTEQESALARLREALLRYEARYGLAGTVKDGDFAPQPRFVPRQNHYEANLPQFPRWLTEEERAALNDLDDEILAAIKKEPTVKLRLNHTGDILRKAGYSAARIESLLARADAQGNGG